MISMVNSLSFDLTHLPDGQPLRIMPNTSSRCFEPCRAGGALTVSDGGVRMLRKAKEPVRTQSTAAADETQLIRLVAAGDLHAFETLYRRYFPRLTRFLDRIMRRPHLVEEAINDTMLVVWQKADTFNGSCKVSTWIFAIAYRKALAAIHALDDPVECDLEACQDEALHDPWNEVLHQESQKILWRSLDALTVDQRAVVVLTYYHGLGYGEIADIMDCPVNTVKTRMFYARCRLKTLLAGCMEEM
jgi:RNA polymerase sigma-70 factor (ECF subfamily)